MDPEELLLKLKEFNFDALREISRAASSKSDRYIQISWEFLRTAGKDGTHVVSGFCKTIAEYLKNVIGAPRTEDLIFEMWKDLSNQGRENICYDVLSEPTILSTDIAQRLFFHPATTAREKRSILANLFDTRDRRPVQHATFAQMIDDLVAHAPAGAAEMTHALISDIKREMRLE